MTRLPLIWPHRVVIEERPHDSANRVHRKEITGGTAARKPQNRGKPSPAASPVGESETGPSRHPGQGRNTESTRQPNQPGFLPPHAHRAAGLGPRPGDTTTAPRRAPLSPPFARESQ
uniref:Uncharacterized protein n=1 Tax=Setaria viridis TaxID=4556 RepID=A0A4U6U9T1_SETVI|nr:hypothetical protein SEVIR_6G179300v2 [Setaria viridis]